FYEMLAGAVPYPASHSVFDLMDAKSLGNATPLDQRAPNVPRPVVALVHQLLAPRPERRVSSAALLATRLKTLYYDSLHADAEGPGTLAPTHEVQSEVEFVGRDAEIMLLRQRITAAVAGEGSFVALLGDAGIGKTRLVTEALALPEAG